MVKSARSSSAPSSSRSLSTGVSLADRPFESFHPLLLEEAQNIVTVLCNIASVAFYFKAKDIAGQNGIANNMFLRSATTLALPFLAPTAVGPYLDWVSSVAVGYSVVPDTVKKMIFCNMGGETSDKCSSISYHDITMTNAISSGAISFLWIATMVVINKGTLDLVADIPKLHPVPSIAKLLNIMSLVLSAGHIVGLCGMSQEDNYEDVSLGQKLVGNQKDEF